MNYIKILRQAINIKKGLDKNDIVIEFYLTAKSYISKDKSEAGDIHLELGQFLLETKSDFLAFKNYTETAKDIYKNTLGTNHINYTRALNSLGFAFQLLGEYREAEKILTEARRIKEKNKVFDIQYGRIVNQLGNNHIRLNKFQEAEECLQTSLSVKEKLKGKDLDYAKTMSNYALLLQAMGRYDDGLLTINEALDILTLSPKVKSNEKDKYRHIKASILLSLNDDEQAIVLYKGIIESRASYETQKSSEYAKILVEVSQAYIKKKEFSLALENCSEAVQIFEKNDGTKHPYYAICLRQKADILLAQNQLEGLDAMYKTVSTIMAQKYS